MNAIESNDYLASLRQEPAQTEQSSRDELGQDEFLTLMIAQFKNQDPFEPMTNGDFLGQLAQFSTVSGISELQTSFDTLAGAISGEQALQAGSLVGKDILTQSEFAIHDQGRSAAWLDRSGRSGPRRRNRHLESDRRVGANT